MTQFRADPPRPGAATTAVEYVAALRDLRIWSGLTFRQLAIKARGLGHDLPASTLASALSRSSLPSRDVVAGIAQACGLDTTSVAEWVEARDALLLRPTSTEPSRPDLQPQTDSPPAMLPSDVADFVGRHAQVAALREALTTAPRGAPPVASVCGMGGIGKTSLALHVAHLVTPDFPDGQLWVDLRDEVAGPLDPDDVLAQFLRALGVDSRALPAGLAERAALYRTTLADRRVLVVLDNASSEQQVRPLLPGDAGCAVLVTSRPRLTGLAGARHLDLDLFSPAEALHLLARITDQDRVRAEPADAARIAELCGCLPLAVRIAGARLAARPAWRFAHLATLLGDERRRLDGLSTGDLAVRASLALSYRGLGEVPRRLLRLLALFDVADFPAWLAATVLEYPLDEAEGHVESLVDAQLLAVSGTDPLGQVRYRFHDLVRLFALEAAAVEEPMETIAEVLLRGFGTWVALAARMAAGIPGPCFALIGSPLPRPTIPWDHSVFLQGGAVAWFDAEHPALMAGARQACRFGLDDLAFDLAGCLEKYFDLRGRYRDWAAINTEVLEVCRQAGNRLGEAVMLRGLVDVTTWSTDRLDGEAMARLYAEAFRLLDMFTELAHDEGISDAAVMCSWALTAAGSYPEAVRMGVRALRVARRCGHLGGQARANLALALAYFEQERFDTAATFASAALSVARRLGNPRWEATTLQYAGIAHRELGDFEVSRRMLDESLAISQAHRDDYTAVLTLLALARLQLRCGEGGARWAAETSLVLSRQYHLLHHQAEALELLGEIELADGRPARAVAHLEQSVALWRSRGWPSFQAAALASLGRANATLNPEAAREAFQEAHQLFTRLGNLAKAAELEPLTRLAIGS